MKDLIIGFFIGFTIACFWLITARDSYDKKQFPTGYYEVDHINYRVTPLTPNR